MATHEPYNPFPQQPPVAIPTPPRPSGNGLAIAGMVIGILGLVAFFVPYVGPILSFIGLLFGIFGLVRANTVGTGKGMAIAGIACGAVGIVVGGWVTYLVLNAFSDYRDKAKTSETRLGVNRISKSIKVFAIETAALPPTTEWMPGLPGAACAEPAKQFPERPYAEWDADEGWKAIDFQVFGSTKASYRWTKQSETTGIIEAAVDYDCDGQVSTTTGTITIQEGNPIFTAGTPTPD